MTARARWVSRLALWLGALLLCLMLLVERLAAPWTVAGASMEPTLRHGDRVLVDLFSYRRRPPREGEVALLETPTGLLVVKRVARAPRRLGEDLAGSRWVVGDNAAASADSRQFGPVPVERFRGRVLGCYWPPGSFGLVGAPPPARPTTFRLPVR